MKESLITLLILGLLGLVVGYYFYAGGYNIAATEPHTGPVQWFLGHVQENSIRAQAAAIEIPSLDDPSQVQTGLAHYHQMCVTCHGAPGIEPSETGRGLYPSPPDLGEEVEEFNEAELFWILKNGLKMTGMPAYGPTHDDESLWGIVAFLKELPDISESQYREMVAAAGLTFSPADGHGEEHSHGESPETAETPASAEEHSHEENPEPHTHEDSPGHRH